MNQRNWVIWGILAVSLICLTTRAADSDKGTFWELPDKADLKVITDPWPAKAGTASLKVEVTTNDDDQKFAGSIDYRIAGSEKNSQAWKPLPKIRQDKDGSTYFEAPITLSKGTCYIQVRVHSKNQNVDLTDWKLDVP